jgi:hypothetical protein
VLVAGLTLLPIEAGISRLGGEVHPHKGAWRGGPPPHGARFRVGAERGASHFAFDLPSRAEAMRSHPLYDVLRRLAQGDVSLYEAEPCPWGVA